MPTYTLLYPDDAGESHFQDVEIETLLTDYATPAPPLSLSASTAATRFSFMKAPAGWSCDWHQSSTRTMFVVMSGDWEVTASDGETRLFGPGAALLAQDITGKGHKSRVVSDSVALMVVW